jgi:lysophospholipase L1-like esterase
MSLFTSNSKNTAGAYATDSGTAAQEPIVSPPVFVASEVKPDTQTAAPTPSTNNSSDGRRRFWKTIRRDAAILIGLVVIAEVLLQILAPEYGHNLYDRTHTGGAVVQFNSQGCRGPDVPLAKAPGELRVLCLGDSVTFGTGIAYEDTWPAQLKDKLAGDSDRPVSVINAGLQGVSLADLTAAYEKKWAQWNPDVVCLVASGNMISLAIDERIDPKLGPAGHVPTYGTTDHALTAMQRYEESAGAMESRLCLPTWLSINSQRLLYFMGVLDNSIEDPKEPFGAMLAHGWVQGGLPPETAHRAWNYFGNDLKRLKLLTRAHGAGLIVAMAPARFELSDSWQDNQKDVPIARFTIDTQATFSGDCRDIDVTSVDLLAALKNGRETIEKQSGRTAPLYILFDYTHLDRDGSGIVADEMARTIAAGASAK